MCRLIAASAGLALTARQDPPSGRKTRSQTRAPDVPRTTGRTRTSSGRALVPYGGAGTPAIDDACTTARAMATGPASVCGVSGDNAGNDGEKSRDQKGSHTAILLLADSNAWQKLEVPPSAAPLRARCCAR